MKFTKGEEIGAKVYRATYREVVPALDPSILRLSILFQQEQINMKKESDPL